MKEREVIHDPRGLLVRTHVSLQRRSRHCRSLRQSTASEREQIARITWLHPGISPWCRRGRHGCEFRARLSRISGNRETTHTENSLTSEKDAHSPSLLFPPRIPPLCRQWLRRTRARGVGRGRVACFGSSADYRSTCTQEPSAKSERQGRRFFVHGGRAEPRRPLRPQTRTHTSKRQAAPRQLRQGHHADGHRRQQSARQQAEVRPSRQKWSRFQ